MSELWNVHRANSEHTAELWNIHSYQWALGRTVKYIQWQSPNGTMSTKWDPFQKHIWLCWKYVKLVSLIQQCLEPRTVIKQGICGHQIKGYWSCPTSVDCPINLTSTVPPTSTSFLTHCRKLVANVTGLSKWHVYTERIFVNISVYSLNP